MMRELELFYDPQDMTVCTPASTTLGELNASLAGDHLYFPLVLDPEMTVGDLLAGFQWASRSYRYGPVCDNVLGFRFLLPSGRRVQVGGRVVKNVTGFDLTRFLVSSGSRFGQFERVVLRLRSLGETSHVRVVQGGQEGMAEFRRRLLGRPKQLRAPAAGAHGGPVRHSRAPGPGCFGQVLDALDLVVDGRLERCYLAFCCPARQVDLFDEALERLARESDCRIRPELEPPMPPVQPLARVKTLISQTAHQARSLVANFGGSAHAFWGNGYFHYQPPEGEAPPGEDCLAALQALHQEVSAWGGHVQCEHLSAPEPGIEQEWEEALRARWEALP